MGHTSCNGPNPHHPALGLPILFQIIIIGDWYEKFLCDAITIQISQNRSGQDVGSNRDIVRIKLQETSDITMVTASYIAKCHKLSHAHYCLETQDQSYQTR